MAKTLDFRRPHLLRNDVEYETALGEVEALMARDLVPSSAEYDRLEFLSVLIEQYEEEEFPIEQPTPQAMVDFMLDQRGMIRTDIADVMGGKSRVSEFFAGKRELSLNQIRALREILNIPADLLIPELP